MIWAVRLDDLAAARISVLVAEGLEVVKIEMAESDWVRCHQVFSSEYFLSQYFPASWLEDSISTRICLELFEPSKPSQKNRSKVLQFVMILDLREVFELSLGDQSCRNFQFSVSTRDVACNQAGGNEC